jgi:hypothetical protein
MRRLLGIYVIWLWLDVLILLNGAVVVGVVSVRCGCVW